MIIEKVVDRFMDENTYILGDEKTKKCAVIDPGGSIIDIFNIIKQHGLTVEYINSWTWRSYMSCTRN